MRRIAQYAVKVGFLNFYLSLAACSMMAGLLGGFLVLWVTS